MSNFLTASPWMRLMRLDRPIGTYLLLWPTLWALWFAGEGHPQLSNLLIFTLGVVVMRAAGCVINDYADRHVDGDVERTKNRPLPAGEINAKAALGLFFGL
ncbi:MAG: UbiA family prenyltransferase, partial [Porticoccaceae bacterium]